MKTVICAIAVLVMLSTAHAEYTYDGVLDPKELDTWKKAYIETSDGLHYFHCEKDGVEALVAVAELSNDTLIIIRYAYLINFVVHVFEYDAHNQHYKQVIPEEVTVDGKPKEGKRI